jgi:hypothetical protein
MPTPKSTRSKSRGTVDEPIRSPRSRNDQVYPIPPSGRNERRHAERLGKADPKPETEENVMGGRAKSRRT